MSAYILSATQLDEEQNHDDLEVIWLGSPDDIPNAMRNFAKYSKVSRTFAECKQYIEKARSIDRFLLVLIGFYEYLPQLNALPQVQSIYIWRKDRQHMRIGNECPKLAYIFHQERHLIERIRQDILLTYRTESPENIFYTEERSQGQTWISFDKTTLFLWNRIMNYYLINDPNLDKEVLKKEMVDRCRLEYRNNPSTLERIDHFDRCRLEYQNNQPALEKIDKFDRMRTEDNAIHWYKQDTFVYRILNKAFRKQNVALIWQLRYIIILLHDQLKELSDELQGQRLTTVYRGQLLEKDSIESLQTRVGHLLSTNTFLSTTRAEDVARKFVLGADSAVIIHINVAGGGNQSLYPFADISRVNSKGAEDEEKEVLFFPGAVFRIDSVKPESDSISIIHLTLMNENIQIIEQLNAVLRRSVLFSPAYVGLLEKTNDYNLFNRYHEYLTDKKFSIGDIMQLTTINIKRLIDNGDDHQKAIQYYGELLLQKSFIDPTKYKILFILIGLNHFRLEQYDYAVDYYTDALESIDDGNRLRGEVYHYLGDVWKAMKDLPTALLCYEKAVQNIVNHPDKNKYIGEIYRKIVEIHFEQKNYEIANIYNDQADEVDKYLREKNSTFIDNETFKKYQQELNIELDSNMLQYAHNSYTNGMRLVRRGQFPQGLQELLVAEQLLKKYLPVYDLIMHKLAKLYEHCAFAYFCLNQYVDALIMWKKAIDIRSSFNC